MAMTAKNTAPKNMGLGNLVTIFFEPGWFSHVVETRIPKKLLFPPEKT